MQKQMAEMLKLKKTKENHEIPLQKSRQKRKSLSTPLGANDNPPAKGHKSGTSDIAADCSIVQALLTLKNGES